MTCISKEKDKIEVEIIMSMLMRSAGKHLHKEKKTKDKIFLDMGAFLEKKPEFPSSFYVCDRTTDERLYTTSPEDIVVSPAKAIGERIEIACLDDGGVLKWMCLKPIRPPKGVAAITNMPVDWFSLHSRKYAPDGLDCYVKQPMAITKDGIVSRIKPLGWSGFDSKKFQSEQTEYLCLILSVFEDAVRSDSYLATVEEHVKLMFPVGSDALKAFFAMRDGYCNTPTGRKNPILHWCSEHLRKTGGNRASIVSAHKRGATEFACGPMTLTIQENEGYSKYA